MLFRAGRASSVTTTLSAMIPYSLGIGEMISWMMPSRILRAQPRNSAEKLQAVVQLPRPQPLPFARGT